MTIVPRHQPTLRAELDGAEIYTICFAALRILPHAAIPAYDIKTREYLYIDRDSGLCFQCCGTFGDEPFAINHTVIYPKIGVHLPDDVAAEIIEWCEKWLRANPEVHCIPASTIAYQRNSYTTTKRSMFTYTDWRIMYERTTREHAQRGGGQVSRGAGNVPRGT